MPACANAEAELMQATQPPAMIPSIADFHSFMFPSG
jgi:hypothetical protein